MFKKVAFACVLSFANTIYSAEPPSSSQNAPESAEIAPLTDSWSAYARRQLYRPDQAVLRNLRALLRQTANPRYWPGRQLLVFALYFLATENKKMSFLVLVATLLQAMHDRHLSSAQLRQKNVFRRFAGWVSRHKLLCGPLFGNARGSSENAERLLQEFAALPTDVSPAIKTIYLDELSDHLERLDAGTEEENLPLTERIKTVLSQNSATIIQPARYPIIETLRGGPVAMFKRFGNALKLQLGSKQRIFRALGAAALIAHLTANSFTMCTMDTDEHKKMQALLFGRSTCQTILACLPAVFLLSLFASGLLDNTLSSAQLRTKNWLRRFAGWALRHRALPFFGADRGSIQNTQKLLHEHANLPASTTEQLKTIYREELQDALDRYTIGSEDHDEEIIEQLRSASVQPTTRETHV